MSIFNFGPPPRHVDKAEEHNAIRVAAAVVGAQDSFALTYSYPSHRQQNIHP